ncbi:protein translocase subunit secY/sec61 alpha [Desulfonatronum thiosulfatophilum]|uniref:Protein translocase subunit SecY n=2 Tax=Desulfonatronum thiosulfatophilum TaxID=617002 RepID=A0A1G6BMV1_9BACT|nr:protein translocase subunit secY/sec61 alpha [Desulfonatronum thiosulfatophilum]
MVDFFASMQGTLFGMFDMFAGGGLSNLSIMALGIMPYISASIIIQLLTVVSPELKRLKEEGAAGRKKITQYTRYGTVLIAAIQGLGIAIGIENMTSPAGVPVVLDGGWAFRLTTIITLVSGTVLLMWIGEQITEYGIGNGISLIIFAGIVAQLPGAVFNTFRLMSAGQISLFVAILLAVLVASVLIFIVFMERGQRRIPIQYAKRMLGRKMYGGQTTHLPLKINTAGVIPPIFASSMLMFPATLASFSQSEILNRISVIFDPASIIYNTVFVALIIFFCYFYTAIIFDPKDIAENIRKQGGFVPGIRPGLKTREYIDTVLSRITLWGSLYISAICVLPMLLIAQFNVPFYFGGTGVLIAVVVAMDTMSKVDSYLITHQYEGLMQKTRIKGRR